MDIEQARFNMVEQQIRPWDVLDQEVLDLLFMVKREDFVPPLYRALAFTDTEIPLTIDGAATGERMFTPKMEARLLQALAVRKHEMVLEVGAGSGYMAALLAQRTQRVVSLEIEPMLAKFAAENLRRNGILNVSVEQRSGGDPAAAVGDSRFDVIMLSGSVPFVPEAWLQRLNVGGRLAAIVGDEPAMVAQLITRLSDTTFETEGLFDTSVARLSGFPRKPQFSF